MPLRNYQANAVDATVERLKKKEKKNGVVLIPTAGGKSHVISNAVDDNGEASLILQPSKEILEQNFKKMMDLGQTDLGIYSASLGSKAINKITFATIGSIYKKPELFREFKNVFVDECDLVNAAQGMYKDFFEAVSRPVVGFTATPWRMMPGRKIGTQRVRGGRIIDVYSGSVNRIITRTRPKIFSDFIHISQIQELYDQGYLCPLDYKEGYFDKDLLTYNTTGNDFTDATYKRISTNVIKDAVSATIDRAANHTLIFTKRIDDAEEISIRLNNRGISCAVVTGDTHPDERDRILKQFIKGKIKAVANVGVLTVGFDLPSLDHIILARPVGSARLYYQMGGRGFRIHPSKTECTFTDLCGTVDRFGKLENWIIADNDGDKKYRLKSGNKFLTGTCLKTGLDLEKDDNKSKPRDMSVIHFGKHKGKSMKDVPTDYLDWILSNFSDGSFKNQAKDEITRRAMPNV